MESKRWELTGKIISFLIIRICAVPPEIYLWRNVSVSNGKN